MRIYITHHTYLYTYPYPHIHIHIYIDLHIRICIHVNHTSSIYITYIIQQARPRIHLTSTHPPIREAMQVLASGSLDEVLAIAGYSVFDLLALAILDLTDWHDVRGSASVCMGICECVYGGV